MTKLGLLAAALALSGCGLIDSDVTNFDLTLKDKQFSVDATGWQVDQNQAEAFLMSSCAGAPMVCMTAATTACPMNCSGSCSGATYTCELGLDIGLYKMIDLITEQPELKNVNDRALIEVEVDSVSYEVTANTLDVETPEMRIYVAPMSIMDPDDPMAKQIGVIAPVPAGETVARRDMTFSNDGRAALISTMGAFKNPFNIIVGSQIVLSSGDMVPTGKLDASFEIKAHAGL
jgi:hypothetical protein